MKKEKKTYAECLSEVVKSTVAEIRAKNKGMLRTFYSAGEVINILLHIPLRTKIIYDEQ